MPVAAAVVVEVLLLVVVGSSSGVVVGDCNDAGGSLVDVVVTLVVEHMM